MTNTCFCGCGRDTSRTFVTGHDTKFVFAVLREVFRDDDDLTLGESLARRHPHEALIVQNDNAWIASEESNFRCRGGGDHMWPPELEHDARCEVCGLKYGEWSE